MKLKEQASSCLETISSLHSLSVLYFTTCALVIEQMITFFGGGEPLKITSLVWLDISVLQQCVFVQTLFVRTRFPCWFILPLSEWSHKLLGGY